MKKSVKIVCIASLFFCFLIIRAFEYFLFYDPFILYFENNHLSQPFPEVHQLKLFWFYFFRYALNSAISFVILKIAFPKQAFLKTVMGFYALAFAVLITVFFILINLKYSVGYLLPFYIRRFLIHPIFILVLFPYVYLLKKRHFLRY